ncbi:MAG: hypothetical protein ABIF77_17745, partial [bacterium]
MFRSLIFVLLVSSTILVPLAAADAPLRDVQSSQGFTNTSTDTYTDFHLIIRTADTIHYYRDAVLYDGSTCISPSSVTGDGTKELQINWDQAGLTFPPGFTIGTHVWFQQRECNYFRVEQYWTHDGPDVHAPGLGLGVDDDGSFYLIGGFGTSRINFPDGEYTLGEKLPETGCEWAEIMWSVAEGFPFPYSWLPFTGGSVMPDSVFCVDDLDISEGEYLYALVEESYEDDPATVTYTLLSHEHQATPAFLPRVFVEDPYLPDGSSGTDTVYVLGGPGLGNGDFEDMYGMPDFEGWIGVDRTAGGVGDFSQVWPALDEIDPLRQNFSPQVAFIDDGIVVPGTGGTSAISWSYGPGGFIVNSQGGMAPCLKEYLENAIWSAILEWPGSGYDGAVLEFDVYQHEEFSPSSPGVFYEWNIRSTDGAKDSDDWTPWQNDDFVYYGAPSYVRFSQDISSFLTPGRTHVQISLGVHQLGYLWGLDGVDATPAPYFDNVVLKAYGINGPSISYREVDIAQDNFPEIGDIDCFDACANHVRFDMAQDISGMPPGTPGDTIVFNIVATRTGTVLAAMPELCYKLDPNPIFSGCRTQIPPGTGNTSTRGCVPGDSVRYASGIVIPDRYCFDLPDAGFFFPGDIIHYYIRAQDTDGGLLATTRMPGDTTGFSFFPGDLGYQMLEYPSSFVVRALPAITSLGDGQCEQPTTLWWNDFANRGLEAEWMHAWWSIGFEEGQDYDIFYTNGPSSGVGNGLGGRATFMQIAGYDMIAYSCGDLIRFTITGPNFGRDVGDDTGVLENWMGLGEKCLFLTGNNLACDIFTGGDTAAMGWASTYLQVALVDCDLKSALGTSNPSAEAVPMSGNPLFNSALRWGTDAYHGQTIGSFDLVEALGAPGKVANWLVPDNSGPCVEPTTAAAAVFNYGSSLPNPTNKVIYLPYDLGYVIDDVPCGGNPNANPPLPVRSEILRDVVHACGTATGGHVVDVPGIEAFTVEANFPNPFNPITKIEYSMPRGGKLTIAIYNVRGELVKTLIDEEVD